MPGNKCRYLKELTPALCEKFGEAEAARMMDKAWRVYEKLCAENAEESKAVEMHTRSRIYPAVAAFQAMLDEDVDRGTASDLLCAYYEKRSERIGAVLRTVLHIPSLYRFVPRFFSKMTKKSFGEAAGFRTKWLRADKEEMRFDMLTCPYQNICIKYDCPEIVRGFCRADDICYGNMHPKLYWGRTKTLGLGGDCCDFRLTIR